MVAVIPKTTHRMNAINCNACSTLPPVTLMLVARTGMMKLSALIPMLEPTAAPKAIMAASQINAKAAGLSIFDFLIAPGAELGSWSFFCMILVTTKRMAPIKSRTVAMRIKGNRTSDCRSRASLSTGPTSSSLLPKSSSLSSSASAPTVVVQRLSSLESEFSPSDFPELPPATKQIAISESQLERMGGI